MPLLQALLAEVGAPGPGGDHQVDGVALGADAELLVADPGQRPQVAALQLVDAHHLALRVAHLLEAERDLHAQDLGAVEQALGVLAQAEDRRALDRVVGAHAFEGAAAVVQRVRQHVDLGVAPVDQLAVEPDLAVAVGHRHRASFGGFGWRPRFYGAARGPDGSPAQDIDGGSATPRCSSQRTSRPLRNSHAHRVAAGIAPVKGLGVVGDPAYPGCASTPESAASAAPGAAWH